ncbi:MAG: hypothetical protein LBG83_00280 [Oscillospiraceae bacterium]|jgi:hypothetical protein|nr:hypothetical protein [Oscillospiraceae bacterium]
MPRAPAENTKRRKEGTSINLFQWFDGKSERRARAERRLRKAWWETAAEFAPPQENAQYDPLGSYTGRSPDGGEPEQDADDL